MTARRLSDVVVATLAVVLLAAACGSASLEVAFDEEPPATPTAPSVPPTPVPPTPSVPPAEAPTTVPAPTSAPSAASTEAWWRIEGYGYLVALDDDDQVTSLAMPTGEWCTFDEGEPRTGQPIELTTRSDGSIDAVFADTSARLVATTLPTACLDPSESVPADTIDAFVSLLDEHYPFFEVREIDWSADRQALLDVADEPTTFNEAAIIIADYIATMNDSHMSVDNVSGAGDGFSLAGFTDAARGHLEAQALMGSDFQERYDSGFGWGRLSLTTGYLAITRTLGFTGGFDDLPGDRIAAYLQAETLAVDAVMQQVLDDLDGAERLIVDLRGNPGGTDAIAHRIVARFIDEPTAIHLEYPHASPGEQHTITVSPASGSRFDGEVLVLVDRSTASAAEILAVAMGEAGAIVVGPGSEGVFSDVLSWQLPGGIEIGLSNEVYLTVGGNQLEVVGVPVHRRTTAAEALRFALLPDEQQRYDDLDEPSSDAVDTRAATIALGGVCRGVVEANVPTLAGQAGDICARVGAIAVELAAADDLGRITTLDAVDDVIEEALVAAVREAMPS